MDAEDKTAILWELPGRSRKIAPEVVEAGSEMMPGQIPDPSLAAGSLPGLGPLAGISATTLTDQLKLADFRQLGTMLSPLHFLGRLGKRPLAIKTEMDEDEERRKRRREKNKVAAARCRNKKKERTDFLQRESERLEMVNSELKAQIEELRQERQQLMVMLNLHRPTCIVRTDSVKTPEGEANPLLEQLSADDKPEVELLPSTATRAGSVHRKTGNAGFISATGAVAPAHCA
ncbi:Jun dimerization protein 2 [Takifugu flavidus]|uniref:Jun dimerization protein 2 n=1 Tax=Takifugu flavidus TaxID=433684 RepID=A0A5C6NTH3_9TELE|nr:Jun dimerization protein 2 [Takifugu flavidus]